jgi:hypothetical protein
MMFSSNAFRCMLVLTAAFHVMPSSAVELTVILGFAENYVILTKAGITNVPGSDIVGNIAVSPIAATAITGFSLIENPAGLYSESSQLVGYEVFAANYLGNTPTLLTTAVSDMETAYTDAANRLNPDAARINLGGGILGGVFGGNTDKLTPGVYTFDTDVNINDDIYFDGSSTDVFIIQMTGNLMQVNGKTVNLSGGALAKNIFWQVAGKVEVGLDAHLEGILLVKTAVLFETGSSLNGRVLSQTACALQQATITQPA